MPIASIEDGTRSPDYFRIIIEEPQEKTAADQGYVPMYDYGVPHLEEGNCYADAAKALEEKPGRNVRIQFATNGPDSENWFNTK